MLASEADHVMTAAKTGAEMEEELFECWWMGHPGSALPVRKLSECHEHVLVVVVELEVLDVLPLPHQHCHPTSHHSDDLAPAHTFSDGSSYCT